jgi:competence protein ComEA
MKIIMALSLLVSFIYAAVDINRASVKELSSLKGIGTKKAKAIVEYRKLHCFKSVDDIVKVKGIGKKFLEKNKKDLKAGKCKKTNFKIK